MRKRKSLFVAVFTLIMSTAILATIGINSVSAGPPYGVPTAYVSWHPTVYTPLKPRAGVGTYVMAFIKVSGLPHETNEPALATDKTWAAEVEVTWDPAVLTLSMVMEPPAWSPGTPTNPGAFWKWHYWWTDYFAWYSGGTYSAGYGKLIDNPNGWAKVGPTLMAPGPETVALPPEMDPLDPFYVPGCPDEGLHDGSYYDFPYSIDGKYENLAILRFQVLDPLGFLQPTSRIHLQNPTFFQYDMGATYHVTTVDGWYGEVGPHLELQGSLLPPGVDPSDPPTTWHELYPDYCDLWEMTSWEDTSGDGLFGVCDLVDMTPVDGEGVPIGPVQWFHVEEVTITLYLEKKPLPSGDFMYIDYERGEEPAEYAITNPISTQWHELWPTYCRRYHLTDWADTGADGELNPSDQIWLTDKETGVTEEYHVVDISTDIIVKPEPGPGLEFPLGLAMEIGLIAAIGYIWWRSRRKTKPIKTTYNR